MPSSPSVTTTAASLSATPTKKSLSSWGLGLLEPQCSGVSERFIRTLKDQLLWLRSFETVAALNEALSAFKAHYKSTWLVAKHRYLTPSEVRAQLTSPLSCVTTRGLLIKSLVHETLGQYTVRDRI